MKSFLKYPSTIFLLLSLLISSLCPGQKPSFGIKAGITFSNATIKDANSPGHPEIGTTGRTSVTAGFYINVPSGKNLIFRPGLEIVSKGVDSYAPYGYPVPFTYLDVPINFLYKKDFTKGHLLAGGGPYIGIAIRDYYAEYPYKNEVGLNALLGYETLIGFSLNVNYSYGLSNASRNTDEFSKITNRYFGITLGYTF